MWSQTFGPKLIVTTVGQGHCRSRTVGQATLG
uniref:Uncharacterized protein n=3 Tax=unclassified Kayfunavirus TaxID=2749939 RepID=A0AAU8GD52_9CAUD